MIAPRIVMLNGRNGQPVALRADAVESVVGEEVGGCTIVTGNETHRIRDSYANTVKAVWPHLSNDARRAMDSPCV